MDLLYCLKKRGLTKYALSRESGVPYSTICDLCNGKTSIASASAGTVYKISKVLGLSMEELLASSCDTRISFSLFKSNLCHLLKERGDGEFVAYMLREDVVGGYFHKEWHAECLYALALLDYVSRENGFPLCKKYDALRTCRLKKPLYSSGELLLSSPSAEEIIPEFYRFNIMEGDVRNVV